ncbi:MAG: potassium channel family protein, partial [Desulfobaccales bacterium]
MVTFRKIAQWAACLLALLIFGSLGFMWLEGWNFFDALYMTVTTLATVGYGEIHPLDHIGRIYNMVLILTGMGVLFYIVSSLARVVIEGELQAVLGRRKLIKHIRRLKNHYIICGFGRIGEIIARHLTARGLALVVIDKTADHIPRLEELGYYFLTGDATRDEVLLEAGIERAKGLVAVVGSDADNVYIVLTARSLNPKLFIVARGEEPGSEQKLLRAGADKVESPYRMGGQKMAHTILHPTVVTFMELAMKQG